MYIIYIYHIWDEVWPASQIYVVYMYIYIYVMYIYEFYMFYIYVYIIYISGVFVRTLFFCRVVMFLRSLYTQGGASDKIACDANVLTVVSTLS